ncbi:sulfurtransferase [Marinicauda salina]|uniref:Sulfurtransferase n=1 Tax=Marinicauda salina TaxID=2135793 RepID=A0A2U2BWV0_9PROT|nr:rhodanese-like domain-containing protein [Marinicauda salina]PWE18498.1 sulfurtransferase [Marinicauda salina]
MSREDIEPQDVAAQLKSGEAILVDVREAHEFGAERIHGALLHPLSTFDPAALPADSKRRVILHCGSGKRSGDALSRCAEAGVEVTAHMAGGIMAWKQAGLPTVTVDPSTGRVIDPQRK